jgi:hypothetical protein
MYVDLSLTDRISNNMNNENPTKQSNPDILSLPSRDNTGRNLPYSGWWGNGQTHKTMQSYSVIAPAIKTLGFYRVKVKMLLV